MQRLQVQQKARPRVHLGKNMSQREGSHMCAAGMLQRDAEQLDKQRAGMRARLREAKKSQSRHQYRNPSWHGGFWSRLLLLLALLLWNGLLQQARADVGIGEGRIKSTVVSPSLRGVKWLATQDGCLIGGPRNLVVDPGFHDNFLEPQPLRTDVTGPLLCQWLDTMVEFHMKQKDRWQARHAQHKREVGGFFYLFKRVKLHFRSFPEFEVRFDVHHMDIWHDDRFGRPMPWVSGHFCYETHENVESSYGVFALSTPPCFAIGASQEQPGKTLVHLLLSPHRGINTRIRQHDRREANKVKSIFTGAVSGIVAGGSSLLDTKVDSSRALVGGLYRGRNLPQISLQIQDFWMNGKTCYIRNRFFVDGIFGATLCHSIAKRGVKHGIYSLWKAHRTESVQMLVTRLDLFETAHAGMYVIMSEGLVDSAGSERVHRIGFDTNPAVIPEYVYGMRTGRFFRASVAIGHTGRIAKNMYDVVSRLRAHP